MTPSLKANELISKFQSPAKSDFYAAKRNALICVEEILNSKLEDQYMNYWKDVKEELHKIRY